MDKHAFLIMAHNQFEILEKLIALLDHEKNDIYIHIDKKVSNFDFNKIKSIAKKSQIIFIERTSINWGGYRSVARGELNLLKASVNKEYDYYHLISGVDLPLKTNEEIHEFFNLNKGKEFVHFCKTMESNIYERFNKYHFFQEYYRSNILLRNIERILIKVQRLIKLNRNKNKDIEFRFGANWFSITHDLAKYVLSKEEEIKKLYRYSECCDEIFLQTIVINSPFKDKLFLDPTSGDYYACVRHIDWKRGNPYVFKESDYNELINSKCMFARKFDLFTDKQIIDLIFNYIKNKNNKEKS